MQMNCMVINLLHNCAFVFMSVKLIRLHHDDSGPLIFSTVCDSQETLDRGPVHG